MGKKALVWLGLGAAALLGGGWLALEPATIPVERSLPAQRTNEAQSSNRFTALPAREPMGRPRGALFEPLTPPAPQASAGPVAEPQPPSVPPLPYRVAGQVVHDGAIRVLLARGDTLFAAGQGDTLENLYRVESIGGEKVTLVYLPLDTRQELALASALTASSPPAEPQRASSGAAGASSERAHLRWHGPERVRAGHRFEVTLKVTSAQELRAAPLQLSYDTSLLEAIDVRAGRLFADGTFSYRINPGGSIFVGASGKGVAAADAELFVVSFKPIRPALAAELRLSALVLQGAGGKPIVHEQPAAFRTTIMH